MTVRFSRESIDSFCGDVLPLRLVTDRDISSENIKWRAEGDAVLLRTFDGEEEFPFSDGVLVTLVKPGEAAIYAALDGAEYACPVSVRQMRRAKEGDEFGYYIGDFHDHTTSEHAHDRYAARKSGFPIDVISQVRDEGLLDFHVISDHGVTLNPRDFFRGFADAERAQPMELVVFPGSESEVEFVESDRYGYAHKNSGEIVTVNAADYAFVKTWDEFYARMEKCPFAVCALAHPQIVGYSVPGIWNFQLDRNSTPMLRRMVKMVEMGNGGDRESNLINEYTYSVALDNGFKVSTTCSSDCHGPRWGYDAFPGKTVIMAREKSKEAFLDALISNRVYACESGNLKLSVTVNGVPAPGTLPPAEIYDFHADIACFHEDETTLPVKCQVISDGGRCVAEAAGEGMEHIDIRVSSDTARWFYLRLVDRMGCKTWSPPVWTGRAPDDRPADEPAPIDKTGMTAVDALSKCDAGSVLCDDPDRLWQGKGETAEIVIDMHAVRQVRGLGHYPVPVTRERLAASGAPAAMLMAQFVSRYRISASADGESYTECAEGVMRVFGGEEIIRFAPIAARYIKFEVLSTVGRAGDLPKYAHARPAIGELTLYA